MLHLLTFITLLLLSPLAFGSDNNSDNLTIPHTFNSGETISSNKMNENFQALITMIENSKKHIYSNGEKIAEFLSYDGSGKVIGITQGNFKFRLEASYQMNQEFANIQTTTEDFLFSSNDCSGTTYLRAVNAEQFIGFVVSGLGKTQWHEFELYSIDEDAQKEVINTASSKVYGSNDCRVSINNQIEVIRIDDNDETKTKLSQINYVKPITIR